MKKGRMSKVLRKILTVFYIFLVLLIIIDLFIHKHGYFGFDEYPSYYGVYGFVACILLVLAAKYILRPIVMRREDYYND
jgi:uncharacterized membrane protein YccC